MDKPLISATTGNKLLIAAIVALGTALVGWLTTSILDTRSHALALERTQKMHGEWLQDMDRAYERASVRIDKIIELLGQSLLINELREQKQIED